MILVRTKRERMVTMSVRVEIRMPDDMHKQVKEDAGKNKVTITDIILDALSDKYLAEFYPLESLAGRVTPDTQDRKYPV